MPGIEALVGQRLKEREELTSLLCRNNGQPGVFYQLPPDDKQGGWERADVDKTSKRDCAAQYPRVVYDFDKQANAERHSSGTLVVYTFCERKGTAPEKLEPLIKDALRDLLIKPDGGFPYCFAWAQTIPFDIPGKDGGMAERGVIGQEIRFDVLEYTRQETTDPDPVEALNGFISDLYPEAVVVGLTHMERFTEASAERPVIYCRLQSAETSSVTNTVVWKDARIAVHIICSDPDARLKIAADLDNRIYQCAEIIMLDSSPMRPTRLTMRNTADYLKDGQLDGLFRYGVLRYRAKPHRIMNVHMALNPEAYVEDYSRAGNTN